MQVFLDLHFQKLYIYIFTYIYIHIRLVDSKSTSFRASKDTGPVVSDKNLQQTRSRVSHGKFCQ